MAHGRDAAYTPRQMSTQSGQPIAALGVSAAPVVDPGRARGRSWVNVLIDRVDRLPGPTWLAYLFGLPPALLLVGLPFWISGQPVGVLPFEQAVWAFALVGSAAIIHYLSGVARDALADFAPMLSADAATLARLGHELTSIPARPALALLAFSAFRTTSAYAFQPESEGLVGVSLLGMAIRWPFETLMFGLVLALLFQTARQLRLVSRIHASAPRVNLFRPGPLYAFSRLTSRAAMGIAILVVPFGVNLTQAGSALDVIMTTSAMSMILVVAVLSFIWPLVGMHRRMDAEKHRLQAETGRRLEALIGELHASIDNGDLARADGQNKTLASLIAERDLLARFSTWPWQAGTAGAVMSAVLLPIALWVVTRLIERVL